jgi:YNFM family putative membrane transporter
MKSSGFLGLQGVVFLLVAAAFTNIYLTQPVLPVLASEFGVNETGASLSISMVILGIALSNLPFGRLGDRHPIRPIILTGSSVVIAGGLVCAVIHNFTLLIAARFLQGLFLPALTTCLAAHLANTLPVDRLNVVMGTYVSATVVGGLGGRLLGGWIHPPLHWRYAFVSASLLLLVAVIAGVPRLSKERAHPKLQAEEIGFMALLSSWEQLRIYGVAFGSFWVFSSTFNYLPFYLSGPPFQAPTALITLLYLVYLIGAMIGPLAGQLSNRIGNGATMALGAIVFGLALSGTLLPSLIFIMASLAGVCAGFFTMHAAAIGALNSKVNTSRGRANALYVLLYYAGGYAGITASGYAYLYRGWLAVVTLGVLVLLMPLATGLAEMGSMAEIKHLLRSIGSPGKSRKH